MSKDQTLQFNKMYSTLSRIAHDFASTEDAEDQAEKVGLEPDEFISMAYDNIQKEALSAIEGIKPIPGDQR